MKEVPRALRDELKRHLLAAVRFESGFKIDELFEILVCKLNAGGFRVGGLLQKSISLDHKRVSKADLIDICTWEKVPVLSSRGSLARGCRLNEQSLASCHGVIEHAIANACDIIVINRFGRAESLGRGLRCSMSAALSVGIPVLTAVREPYIESWLEFSGTLGVLLEPKLSDVVAWLQASAHSGRMFGYLDK